MGNLFGAKKMKSKILILLITLGVAFIFCGAASAATTQTSHLSTIKVVKSTATADQVNPAIDGSRITWVQTDSSGFSIYYKNLATGFKSKVCSSKQILDNPDISGTRVVWEQYDSSNKSSIFYKNLATGAGGKYSNHH